jgi:histidinol-phosphate phosphatase family protein
MSEKRRAAFLDRDGTLIEDSHYLSKPEAIRILPGAVDAVKQLNTAAVVVVIVTNQSGIARGLMTEEDYTKVAARLVALFADAGAKVDASYHCPHHPAITGACDCRKPSLGMYIEARDALGLDTPTSLFAGDRFRDVAPGIALGGRAILIPSSSTPHGDITLAERDAELASSLGEAVDRYLRGAT